MYNKFRQYSWRIFKIISTGATVTLVGGSAYFLYQNNYDLSSIGATRFARAGFAVLRVMADYKWTLRGLDHTTDEYTQLQKVVHKRSAEVLLRLACANGGVWIKVGQHCASLEYLLPEEYTSTLSVLHSRAPESSLDDVKQVIREDLHAELNELFSEFDLQPLGAASLAQVHRAKLRTNGDTVAVKVQHPRVKPHSIVDMASMEILVRIASKIFPDLRLMWLVDEAKRNLPVELDFLHEANNADRVRIMFAHLTFLKVPKMYYDISTDRVLVMEYCEGEQINNLKYIDDNHIDRHDICRKLGKLYSEMIFVKGYIHCDPHPGNVLVHRNADTGLVSIVLLDHGLYQILNDDFRIKYANLWLALLKPDPNAIKYWCGRMGVGDLYGLFACMITARSWESVTNGIDRNEVTDAEIGDIKSYVATLLNQISDVLERMPRPMLLVLKTNDLLRSIEYRLGTHSRKDSFIEMTRCCFRAVYVDQMQSTNSLLTKCLLIISLYTTLAKLFIYQQYLTGVDIFSRKMQ